MLGFVGGIVDEGETPEEACTRECCEELGIAPSLLSITKKHHLFTHFSDHTKYCLHFYAIEIPYSTYTEIEAKVLQSRDWGDEVSTVSTMICMHFQCSFFPCLFDTEHIHDLL